MQMSEELEEFIKKNIDLINQNIKESWEEIYKRLGNESFIGGFTEIMLKCGIDPAEIIGYIPNYYLFYSTISDYVIPDNVTSIGDYAFQHCISLTSVTIPDKVTNIGYEAFDSCINLTSIEIPSSVTKIREAAFGYCSSLTKVNYTGTIDEWIQIDFEDSYSNPLIYAKNLYVNNQLVTKVVLTNTTRINAYAFFNCTNLTDVTISNNVTSIGSYAFSKCNSLNEIKYLGTKQQAMKVNYSPRWRDGSNINKIICTDGAIEL